MITLFPLMAACLAAAGPVAPTVQNPGFEIRDAAGAFARNWIRGYGPGTQASADIDTDVHQGGRASLRIHNETPTAAYKYALVNSDWIEVTPDTTYRVRFRCRGQAVGKCFVGAAFQGGGEHRQPLPTGDYDWREITCRLTTPNGCRQLSLHFVSDGVTGGVWIDDVSLERSPVQLANLAEVRVPLGNTWFERTPGVVPRKLVVVDVDAQDTGVNGLMIALQGVVNRTAPRLYLVNQTNPRRYDDRWLAYMQAKGYTGKEERITPKQAIRRFRAAVHGVIIWDPELPGTRHAAWMLAGLLDALPASPETAAWSGLPTVADLRGRWHRNVDAYRYVYNRYWTRMSHRLLAWEYPGNTSLSSRDVMVQQRVFLFWISAPTDNEKGADPVAELEFAEELLSKTPGNLPVMGWPMYVDKGMEEYTAVRLMSEYGKWVPGTGFNSNVTVHSAIRPKPSLFRQDHPSPGPDENRLYLSVNILDSGDAHWYWQLYQQGIWEDPVRGSLPIGYGMNVTILDTLPLVAQWYYEKRTPRDELFGLLYMNGPVYAARFRPADRERIWREYVALFDRYRRALDMDGIELYNGGSSGPSAPISLLRRYTKGMPGLKYILADLGRHTDTTPANACGMLDGTVVLHTLTNFQVWSSSDEVAARKMEGENRWLLGEIKANAPTARPGYMSAMAISWSYYPAWLKDLQSRLPADYVTVGPGELAARARRHLAGTGK